MLSDWPLLSLITFAPAIGALLILAVRGEAEHVARNARWAALFTSLITFALSLVMIAQFDAGEAGFQLEENIAWFPGLNINYHMGVDGISVLFVLLSTFLTPICIVASWTSVKHRVREYMVAFLVLETLMIGMFCALDFLLFYVFFEGVLIPMFLIIGIWGGQRRAYASVKFFLYTLLGSVLMLLAILALYVQVGTTDIATLMARKAEIPLAMQYWLWLALFASFAVKVPMWPVHTWLPDAHVEAPTAGSVILAGVLLKMGGYGFLRLSIPLLPGATEYFAPLVFALSVVAIVYTSLVALVQTDMKKLIAYSSVAHMGYVTIGVFTLNHQGMEGAIFQMLSHGLVSGALFLCVGVVYDRLHTREMARYGGVAHVMPKYALVFMLMMLASAGLPGTSGFVGEFLVLMGAFEANTWVSFLAATALVLGAAYMLVLYRKVMFGPVVHDDVKAMKDLRLREMGLFVPLIALVLWLGVYPGSVFAITTPSVEKLVSDYRADLERIQAAEAAEAAPTRLAETTK